MNRALRLLPFGMWLATRSPLARASLVLAAACAIGAVAAAAALRGTPAAQSIPAVASAGIAWGAGTMVAFGAALRSIRQDREEGVLLLARSRGFGVGAYGLGRVLGLVAVLAIAVGGGTLVACLAASAVAGPSVLRSSAASIVFALAFAVTLGPVAMAALGGRTRSGGYLALLAVLALPELLAPWTRQLLPHGWHELASIPAALDAVRAGVQSGGRAVPHAARAVVGLLAVGALSWMVVRARLSGAGAGDL